MADSMDLLAAFLPIDRRLALARGEGLPDRTQGAALFADISGFTPLTAALARELGRQRGAEKLLDYLNPIYEALVGELHRHRGSAISFAGDSITCWLDGDDGRRAVGCALGMQALMRDLAEITTPGGTTITLSIKIGLSAGPARRFLAGDPAIYNCEVLAGATLGRMAGAEHQARSGEVIASQEVAEALGADLAVAEWRHDEAGRAFAVVAGLANPLPAHPWPAVPAGTVSRDQLRSWIAAPVYERLAGGVAYLAELRPVTCLFIYWAGIDYDGDDDAGARLDAYVRWVQSVLARYEGYLQISSGDKGGYLLAIFGAPLAHDDDDARAVATALDLQALPPELAYITPAQAGISRGLVWAGACGGRLRCIYTVMGDEVNMAARLMGKAAPGQVLVNQAVADATAGRYRYRSLGPVPIKGRVELLPVAQAVGRQEGLVGGATARFAGRLVGREAVLAEMEAVLAAAGQGQGRVLRLEGTAGIGKSHLVAAFAARAAALGWQVCQATCQSITQGTAYAPWRQLFAGLLDLPVGAPLAAQIEQISQALLAVNPAWQPRLPLLAGLLGLPMASTPETAGLEPRLRQQMLFALVAEILQAWARRQPLLLVFEDVHWLDEASAELVLSSARALATVPALLLAVQRPALDADRPILPGLDRLHGYYAVQLGDLPLEGVQVLVSDRLGGPLTPLVGSLVFARAQGNPFFTEELVDSLREAGYVEPDRDGRWVLSQGAFDALLDANCLVREEGVWRLVDDPPLGAASLDIPDSVQGTVLARLDRLPEPPKLTLKVASVIGRTFSLATLADVHPVGSDRPILLAELEEMAARDFVHAESLTLEFAPGHEDGLPIPDTRYLFKHNTTQEVAYSTLLFAQRQALHASIARWHEDTYGGGMPLDSLALDSPLAAHYPLLVHHWHHAEHDERERLYAGLAGEQAAAQYANEGAMRYLSRALELTPASDTTARAHLLFGREQAANFLGRRDEQHRDLAALEGFGTGLSEAQLSQLCLRQASLAQQTDDYEAARAAVARAVDHAVQAGDLEAEIRAQHEWGRILWMTGDYAAARTRLSHALAQARATGNRLEQARILYDLGSTCYSATAWDEARSYLLQAQEIYDGLGSRMGEGQCQLMLGLLAYQGGAYAAAEAYYRRALAASRAIAWRYLEAHMLTVLGVNACDLGDYGAARDWNLQAIAVAQEIGYPTAEANSLDTLSLVGYALGEHERALDYAQRALQMQREAGNRRSEAYVLHHLGLINAALGQPQAAGAAFEAALAIRSELGQEVVALDDRAGLARLALDAGDIDRALAHAEHILAWLDGHSPDGIEFPALVYLTCYQALRTAGSGDSGRLDRACRVLTDGYNLIQRRAAGIQDEAQQQRFLEQVPHNRELLAAWKEMAGQGPGVTD